MIAIKNIESTLNQGLKNSMSYDNYISLVKEMVTINSTTGNDLSEVMVNYTKLNDRRLKRWNKTLKISEKSNQVISNYNKKITWLVLTESWCGDAAHIMPIINKVAELNDNIQLKIVLRDDNNALMNEFLTNGGQSIPKLIMIDNLSGEVINTFGPRPSVATCLVNEYKEIHGKLTPEFKEDLQKWYNKDKGQSTIDDLLKLLEL